MENQGEIRGVAENQVVWLDFCDKKRTVHTPSGRLASSLFSVVQNSQASLLFVYVHKLIAFILLKRIKNLIATPWDLHRAKKTFHTTPQLLSCCKMEKTRVLQRDVVYLG